MTRKTIKVSRDETNKLDVYHIDDSRSSDILDLKDYDPENKKVTVMF